jgi:replicative DNA helicase
VILLHREMGYTDYATNTLDVIVAKNRQGPTGRIVLEWQGDFVRAVEGEGQYGR